jgi:nucleolar complex protein 2
MGRKATKATKKFVSSGQLKKTIEARHKSKQFKKKFQSRRGQLKDIKGKERPVAEDEDSDEEQEAVPKVSSRYT